VVFKLVSISRPLLKGSCLSPTLGSDELCKALGSTAFVDCDILEDRCQAPEAMSTEFAATGRARIE
jgi:hypothetical protein